MFQRPAPRGLAAIAVLLAWTASLAWLGVRHFGTADSESLSGEASLRIAPGDAWLAIMAGDVQVGTAGVTLDTLSPGFRIQESVTLELPKDGVLVHSARFTRVVVGPTLSLQELTTSWSRPGRRTGFSLTREGDSLQATYEPGGPSHRSFRPGEPMGVLHIFPYQLALSRGMDRGRQLTQLLVDGWPASARQSRITVGRDTAVSWPDSVVKDFATGIWDTVTTLSANGVIMTVDGATGPYQIVTDKRGRLQGMETLFGVRWVRQNFDIAMNAFGEAVPAMTPRILAAYPAVAALTTTSYPVTDGTAERRFLLAHRDGTPLIPALRAMLAGGRQRVMGDTLIILAPDSAEMAVTPARDADLRSVDPLLLESRAIRSLAQSILRAHVDSAVPAILAYLRKEIRIDTAITAPQDAYQTLTESRGRPDGVARLFVMLARSGGLTARYVTGVRPRGDTLFTHAWAEVRNAKGAWIAVDPVRGELAASTTLIRLGWGGSTLPEDMLHLLANARLTPILSDRVP